MFSLMGAKWTVISNHWEKDLAQITLQFSQRQVVSQQNLCRLRCSVSQWFEIVSKISFKKLIYCQYCKYFHSWEKLVGFLAISFSLGPNERKLISGGARMHAFTCRCKIWIPFPLEEVAVFRQYSDYIPTQSIAMQGYYDFVDEKLHQHIWKGITPSVKLHHSLFHGSETSENFEEKGFGISFAVF